MLDILLMIKTLTETGQAVYILLMIYGILVFGDLLSELAEINRASRNAELEQMEKIQVSVSHSGLSAQRSESTHARTHTHTHQHIHTPTHPHTHTLTRTFAGRGT
jgi:hypothetical protein